MEGVRGKEGAISEHAALSYSKPTKISRVILRVLQKWM